MPASALSEPNRLFRIYPGICQMRITRRSPAHWPSMSLQTDSRQNSQRKLLRAGMGQDKPSGGSILHPSRCIYSPIQRPVTVTVYANHLPHAQWWISYTTEFSVGISVSAPESCSQLLWRSSAGVIRDTLASGYRELGVQSARDYPRRNASAASSVIWRYGRYGERDFRTVGACCC